MLRGIILGGASGLAIALALGAVVSLSVPMIRSGPEATPTPDVPETAAFNDARTDLPASLPAPITTPDRPDVVRPERPTQGDTLALAAEALQSVDTPELSAPVVILQTPDAAIADNGPGEDLATPNPVNPVYPSPQAVTPQAPADDTIPQLEKDTPQPPRAAPGEEMTGFPTGDLTETVVTPPTVGSPQTEPGLAEPDPETMPEAIAKDASNATAELSIGSSSSAPLADNQLARNDRNTQIEQPTIAPPTRTSLPEPEQNQPIGDQGVLHAQGAPTSRTSDALASDQSAPQATLHAPLRDPAQIPAPDTSATSSNNLGAKVGPSDIDPSLKPADPATDIPNAGEIPPVASQSIAAPVDAQPRSDSNDAVPTSSPSSGSDTEAAPDNSAAMPPEGPAAQAKVRPAGEATALPGVPARRLVGAQLATEGTESTAEQVPPPLASDAPEDIRPPIDRFAQAFENPEGKPILSIVMIDDGTSLAPLPANFPYPLSLAVPVTRPDAKAAMRQYRADGYEVLALAALPLGSTAQDIEVASQAWFSDMDQVVALMESPPSGLQSDRERGEQLAAILETSGHGLLLYPEGLDTTRKLASRRDVPAATVFRDLDAEGQGAAVIRRFLDNSAFKAGVEGSVILVTRLRPETIEALLVWGLADRASRVALAPISYALKSAAP